RVEAKYRTMLTQAYKQHSELSMTASKAKGAQQTAHQRLFLQSNELSLAARIALRCGVRVLLMFKLCSDKKVIPLLSAVLVLLLFGTDAAFASHQKSDRHLSYRTRLDRDLDGDQ